MIERFRGYPCERKGGGTIKHLFVKAEDTNAVQQSKRLECCIDLSEIMLDPVLVSAENYSGGVAIGLRYLTGGFCPIQKPPNRFCLPARLALRQNGLASLATTG